MGERSAAPVGVPSARKNRCLGCASGRGGAAEPGSRGLFLRPPDFGTFMVETFSMGHFRGRDRCQIEGLRLLHRWCTWFLGACGDA